MAACGDLEHLGRDHHLGSSGIWDHHGVLLPVQAAGAPAQVQAGRQDLQLLRLGAEEVQKVHQRKVRLKSILYEGEIDLKIFCKM